MNQTNKKRTRPSIYLRMSDKQLSHIESLADARGEKVQEFLISCALKEGERRPVFSKEISKELLTEIKRIGNNFNQIARKLNSGFRKDWYDSFESCEKSISAIRKVLTDNVAS